MRHLKRGRRLSRTSSHRKAMFRNLVAGLFRNGKIITTPAKAKEARPFAERLITLAKKGPNDLAARRRAIRLLHDPALVRSLFEDLGVRYKERPGGYTRILHLSRTRIGDGASLVLFELVEGGMPAEKGRKQAPRAAAVVADPSRDGLKKETLEEAGTATATVADEAVPEKASEENSGSSEEQKPDA